RPPWPSPAGSRSAPRPAPQRYGNWPTTPASAGSDRSPRPRSTSYSSSGHNGDSLLRSLAVTPGLSPAGLPPGSASRWQLTASAPPQGPGWPWRGLVLARGGAPDGDRRDGAGVAEVSAKPEPIFNGAQEAVVVVLVRVGAGSG